MSSIEDIHAMPSYGVRDPSEPPLESPLGVESGGGSGPLADTHLRGVYAGRVRCTARVQAAPARGPGERLACPSCAYRTSSRGASTTS